MLNLKTISGKETMNSEALFLQVILQISILLLGIKVVAAVVQPAPGCPTTCGDVSIPFPSGTRADCYLNETFSIFCDTSFNPAKPFYYNSSGSEIFDISLDGQLRAASSMAYDCYHRNGWLTHDVYYEMITLLFVISSTRNKFTVVGCDTYAFIEGYQEKSYATGCTAVCDTLDRVENGSCSGIGCCQMSFPKGVRDYTLSVNSYSNHTMVNDFNPCGYAFVVQDGYYNFSSADLMGLQKKFNASFPIVFEWSVGDMKCQEAQKNSSTYARKSKYSECDDSSKSQFIRPSVLYITLEKGIDQEVAIEKSRVSDQGQIEQFINEVIILSQINHRNVVKLLGCCLETQVPLLVYEFITNGTLHDHIHGERRSSSFTWDLRLKIATETAGALAYLHSAASMPIIHRDIKSANILLDNNFTAKVSDFGASRFIPKDQTQVTTLVQGTFGYLDPEYFHSCQLTEKSDVYSFGVVLAELLTGEKALSFNRSEEEMNLALYFTSFIECNKLLEILDKQLLEEGNVEHLKEVAMLANQCLCVKSQERPTMKEVAVKLEGFILNVETSLD